MIAEPMNIKFVKILITLEILYGYITVQDFSKC